MNSTHYTIIGNDGMASLVLPWCELFREKNPNANFSCTLEGSSTAILALAADASWLAPMSRAPWPHEWAAFEKQKGYLPQVIHVGYAGHGPRPNAKSPPAIYKHHSNPLPGLTMSQIAAIFSTGHPQGNINLWRQLGIGGAWHDRRIHLYGLRDNGKYATAFRYAHLNGQHYPIHFEALPDRQAVLSAVANDPFGLGSVGWYDAAKFAEQVSIVPLAATPDDAYSVPSLHAVANGHYPLASYLSIYLDIPPGSRISPAIREWLTVILSSEGQAIIAAQTHSAEGYIPLAPAMLALQRQCVESI